MRIKPVLQTWGRALSGRIPSLSLEITRECPLRCPGCYAYEDSHLGTANLRSLSDYKGNDLVERVLKVVKQNKPLHLSIVGGDPLVRYRELDILLPQLVRRSHVQVVTSAFRAIPLAWASLPNLTIVVSIDGLQSEHDVRRRPATYERILRHIKGHHVTVHCTITSAMVKRSGYIPEFVELWASNPAVAKIWMSIFTPQRGARNVECLTVPERRGAVETLLALRQQQSKLDMPKRMIEEFLTPPTSPERCIFARTTRVLSADLKTHITPCQFGGDPDCSQCGCIASMGLAALGHHKAVGSLTAGDIFWASTTVGENVGRIYTTLHNCLSAAYRKKPCAAGGDQLEIIPS